MGRNKTWLARWRIEIEEEEEEEEELLENASVHLYDEINNTAAGSYVSIFHFFLISTLYYDD